MATIIDDMIYRLNSMSCWIVILIFLITLIALVYLYRLFNIPQKPKSQNVEAFTQEKQFVSLQGAQVFDDFYATMFDDLFYKNIYDEYEVGLILNKTKPVTESDVLVIGSKSGFINNLFQKKGYNSYGIETSPFMVKQAKQKYPSCNFITGNPLDLMNYDAEKFSLISILDFSLYMIHDRRILFDNCYKWLLPGGYFVIHLVNTYDFYNSQVYATKVNKFNPIIQKLFRPDNEMNVIGFNNKSIGDFDYKSQMILGEDNNIEFQENFKNRKDGRISQQIRKVQFPDMKLILSEAKDAGFNMLSQLDLISLNKPYQYLFILYKPSL